MRRARSARKANEEASGAFIAPADPHQRKLDREPACLNTVYVETEFESVRLTDRPDFILQHRSPAPPFGVEVTDLYQSESEARLAEHPDYISELLAGGDHMHRDDQETLKVSTVTIHGPKW